MYEDVFVLLYKINVFYEKFEYELVFDYEIDWIVCERFGL